MEQLKDNKNELSTEAKIARLNLSELCHLIDDIYDYMPAEFEIMKPIFNNELQKRGIDALLEEENRNCGLEEEQLNKEI